MRAFRSLQLKQSQMQIDLTPAQFQVLAGLLDQAIKSVGIRAMEDDVIDLMRVIKSVAQKAQTTDEGS
jgi:hypothetical protein